MTTKRLHGIDFMLVFASKPVSAFRRAAFAAAVIGASALTAFSANAQQIKSSPVSATPDAITATTNCKQWNPSEVMSDTKCEILKGQLVRAQNACIDELVKFKNAAPEEFVRLGFASVTRETACTFVSRIPKRAASLAK